MKRAYAAGAAVGVLALCGCTIEQRTDRIVTQSPDSASEFIRPWSEAPPAGVRSGDLVWIWGITGTVRGSVPPRIIDGGAAAEARQALENLLSILESAGVATRDVAQCSVFVADSADLAPVREVYAQYFPTPPRRTAVADGLGGARVEIECTAVSPAAP
jgi:enamine deaminase RidA (YjgF/YER057c/UK114 family)